MSYQADGSIVVLYPPKNVSNQWFSVRWYDAFAAAVHLNKNLKRFILFIYLFWFCLLFQPCYAYIVQIQHITVRWVISLTQFPYEVNSVSAQNGTWPCRSPVCKTACRSFHFRNKNLDLTETDSREEIWTTRLCEPSISLLVNQYMNTAIKSTGGMAAEQSLAGRLAVESGANDTMSHLLQL